MGNHERVLISGSSMISLCFRIIGERVDKGCERSNRASVGEAVAGAQRELTRV